ncbi:MAG: type II toxin-antitoxin system PemK/MazF family toxin [Pyrinomonadaceae bacterium]|jgi:mRNA interferase MazF|nr:type II toxin-antitoxin system PemK/MazF family toxin [Pyrinomonadaceae bacterium]MDQ3586673.1 type II toxin-antitoxin system PemK/MazF family toxin [Acidobacteriota bacterium]
MPSYSKNEVVLVRYPFSDLSSSKIRPAVIVNAPHSSQDVLLVPLTSRTAPLLSGEFALTDWKQAGLNIETAVKRGIFTIHQRLILQSVGKLADAEAGKLDGSLRDWLGLR